MSVPAAAFALAAALLFALAAVAQQRVASRVPDDESLGLGLARRLVTSPLWLVASVGDLVGYGLQAVALGLGAVVLVEPLLSTMVLFALVIGAWSRRRRPSRGDLGWGALLCGGLALFLIVGDPSAGVDSATWSAWTGPLALVVGGTVLCVAVATRSRGTVRAVALGAGSGLMYGLSAPLTKSVVDLITGPTGPISAVSAWESYALIVALGAGVFLQQSSFQAGSVAQSLPVTTVLSPVVAVFLGVTVLQEQVAFSGLTAVGVLVAAAAMAVATAALARDTTLEATA